MNKRTNIFFIYFIFFFPIIGYSQNSWTLEECINYALKNSLELDQSLLQENTEKLQYDLQKAKKIPSLSLFSNGGIQLGRSIDPTTNTFTNREVLYQTYGMQSNLTLYNWSGIKNLIKASEYRYEASTYKTKETELNTELNIITSYISMLNSKRQLQISKEIISLTSNQIKIVDSLIFYGKATKVSQINLKAQLSKDSITFLQNMQSFNQSRTELMHLLNLPLNNSFDIKDSIINEGNTSFLYLLSTSPESIAKKVSTSHPSQLASLMETKSLALKVQAAKSAKMPTISMNTSIGSNYSNNFTQLNGKSIGYFDQILNTNLSRNFMLSITIPVFSQKNLSTNIELAKINLKNQQIEQLIKTKNLEKLIYIAFDDAKKSYDEYKQNCTSLVYTEEAFRLNKMLFENGKIAVGEFLNSLNELSVSKLNNSYIFYNAQLKVMLLKVYDNET